MITDIFLKRYPQRLIFESSVPPEFHAFFNQFGAILHDDILSQFRIPTSIFDDIQKIVIRETGRSFWDTRLNNEDGFPRFLFEPYDLWKDSHGSPDYFFKAKITLIELAMKEIEKYANTPDNGIFSYLPWSSSTRIKHKLKITVANVVEEINLRMRTSRIPLHYHNGLIQIYNSELITHSVEEPFWELLNSHVYKNVDIDMKEAIDKRDRHENDAAFYALKALESTLKIISDNKCFTTGSEKGASNYIDNLVSQKNGRFIEVWESEMLKYLFSKIRNPLGHGPGKEEMIKLSKLQMDYVIENSMIWIKSLIMRI